MMKLKKICAAITLLGFINIQSYALKIDTMYFIGDSLTDQGNIPLITPHTNGNTYAFYLGQKFGQTVFPSDPVDPFAARGIDYARFGASTGFDGSAIPVIGSLVKNGFQQIDELLQNNRITSHSLFVYWLGANDIILSLPIEGPPNGVYPDFNATASANNIVTGLNKLHNAGAKYIVVLNMPALERTPAGLTAADPQDYFIEPRQLNQEMLNRLNNIGYRVIQLDIFATMNFLLDNFKKFGYTNITTGCNDTPGQNCATSFFYDDVHPTDKTHRILADFIYATLTAPDFVATLAEVPISLMQAQYANIRQQLYPQIQNREVGKTYTFISGNGSPRMQAAIISDRVDYDFYSGNLTIGLLRLLNEEFSVGAAVGKTLSKSNYDMNSSQFKTNATTFSVFGSYQRAKFYINAIINYAHLHYQNIQRKFYVGPILFSADGDTNGHQHGISIQSGYNLTQTNTFQFGPIVNLEYQRVDVNGYDENNAEVFNLVFDDQNNDSLIGGAGFQATALRPFCNTLLTANAFFTVNKQFLGGERDIFFHQASIAANFASLPVEKAEEIFANVGLNIADTFNNGLIASLGYILDYGDNQFQSNLIIAGLSIPL